jgi:regulatory protein
MRSALLRAGHDEAEVEAAIARLRGERFLDDAGLASRYARSRIAHQGLGRRRIREALREKGVESSVVESGLAEALRDVSESAALDSQARRYWRLHEREEPRRRLRRLWALLLRRGFPADLVHARLRALWPRHQDALDGLEPEEPNE